MEFKYKISNLKETKTGTVEAESKDEAVALIKREGFFIMEISEKQLSFFRTSLGGGISMGDFDRINFTDHLASMIGAGSPIRDALEAFSEDDQKKSELIGRIVQDIERGRKLSQSLARFPNIFSPLYLALVRAGEISGSLDETLLYLSNELRREYEFKARVKSAMFYPILVICVSVAVIIFVITTVIPRVSDVAKSMGTDMPFMTKMVVSGSDFFRAHLLALFLTLVSGIIALSYLFKDEKFRDKLKNRLLYLPLVGGVIKKYTLARLLRIIGSCVRYGIPLPSAFEAAEDVVNNPTYKEAIVRMNKKITKGESLAKALSTENKLLFPGIIIRSIKGAEKTGTLDSTLNRLSVQYELEVDRDLKRATELIEPLMIVILGVIVLGIAVSVIAPIYQLTSSLK